MQNKAYKDQIKTAQEKEMTDTKPRAEELPARELELSQEKIDCMSKKLHSLNCRTNHHY